MALLVGFGRSGTPAGAVGSPVRSLRFPGPFVPSAVVSADGAVWVVGTQRSACAIERIDPVSLRAEAFGLPACGSYVTTGDGSIFLAAGHEARGDNGVQFHLERFDPSSGRATVMTPVMATAVGSDQAHFAMTYGDRYLWLASWDGTLRQVSPSTGRVVRTIPNVSTDSEGHPALTANAGGTWMAGGPGGGNDILRIPPGSARASVVYRGPARSSVLWLATVGDTVWAEVATYGRNGTSVSTRLVAFDLRGRRTLRTPNEPLGTAALVGAGSGLYSIGSARGCDTPQRLWQVDPKTGHAVRVRTLATPVEPCLTGELASLGGAVFVLEATGSTSPHAVLYRIEAKRRGRAH